ncbi:transport and Golgi organization protein 1 homolog [Camelus dromedarius]|uniref:transport and Golgi organization protein 1 homolog n=1 Tax=Camelus dromedarius TaxID=9838 RepID=UPI00311A6F77
MNGCELMEKQQLLAAKEEAKLAEEETRWYKIRLEECHGQMREAEIIWRHQVTLAEKKAQDSSLRAQELEREISELRRENSDLRRENSDLRRENSSELRREVAHLKQRLDAICRRRQAEEYMRQDPTPGGPYRLHPPLRGHPVSRRAPNFTRTSLPGLPGVRPVVAQVGTCTRSPLVPCATSPPTASCSAR